MRLPTLCLIAGLAAAFARAEEKPNPVMAAAQQRIAAFHADEKPSGAVLRLVYFHAADRDPLPDFAARLDRIMTDISGFYRDGLERLHAREASDPVTSHASDLARRVSRT